MAANKNAVDIPPNELPKKLAPGEKPAWYQSKKSGKVNPLVRWCYGLAKEFRRIQWMKGHDVIEAIFVVLITILILVGIFAAVDAIFLQGQILGG